MRWLYNLKTQRKMLILNILVTLNLIWISYNAMTNLGQINSAVDEIYNVQLVGLDSVLTAQNVFNRMIVEANNVALASNSEEIAYYKEAFERYRSTLMEKLDSLDNAFSSEEGKAALAETRSAIQEALPQLEQIVMYGESDLDSLASAAFISNSSIFEKAGASFEKLAELKHKAAHEAHLSAAGMYEDTFTAQLIIIIIGVITNVLVAWYISTVISKPLNKFAGYMTHIAQGDLSQHVDIDSKDEIGNMAKEFNMAMEKIRGLMRQVQQTAQEVLSSSQGLAASSGETGRAAQQVASTVEELARGAEEQAKSANIAGRAVNQMSEIIKSISAKLQNMVADSSTASEAASTGASLVKEAVAQMDSIRNTVDNSASVVKGLGERSREIGQIVDVITGIAEQTNLLALNAAIEAARAGEQGRGFAVVAEEVRKLAEQSRQAAEQISGLIQEIQSETAKAVAAMESGTKEVASGSAVINNTGSAFEEIARAVETVVKQINEVSAAAQQMNSSSEEVVSAVENIANITEESAASTEEVSASAEEQTAAVQEIASAADSLAQLAKELQEEVDRFKLD
ncbi:MAG: methyl-accepting chemotaxis protein [Firmicutes bacterium]|nr:methyl-accepting chemotaxis protein [Bacillota bacterium]